MNSYEFQKQLLLKFFLKIWLSEQLLQMIVFDMNFDMHNLSLSIKNEKKNIEVFKFLLV